MFKIHHTHFMYNKWAIPIFRKRKTLENHLFKWGKKVGGGVPVRLRVLKRD